MTTFYDVAAKTARFLALLLAQTEVQGIENVPSKGAFVVAPNHFHVADPAVLCAFFPRRISFMVKQEAWDTPIFGWLSRQTGAFPVRRGEIDRVAYRRAREILNSGEVLGIFPEGHRSIDGKLQPGQPGAIVLAQRAGVPIVPVALSGICEVLSYPGLVRRQPIRIVIGQPYHPPQNGHAHISEAVNDLMARISELLPPQHQSSLGEHTRFS